MRNTVRCLHSLNGETWVTTSLPKKGLEIMTFNITLLIGDLYGDSSGRKLPFSLRERFGVSYQLS